MSEPLRLLETMRAENGRIPLLDRHLHRLARSASDLDYPLHQAAVRERLAAAVASRSGTWGVRLTLGAAGDVEVEAWPLADEPFRTVVVHPEPVEEAGGPLCTHKTTRRDHYRRRYDWARQRGADEAVLLNPAGEVTEGSRTTVWVERSGRLWTPPLSAGGLAGVMREHVLASRPEAHEAPLAPEDLRSADALFLSNALRGWMPVTLLAAGP